MEGRWKIPSLKLVWWLCVSAMAHQVCSTDGEYRTPDYATIDQNWVHSNVSNLLKYPQCQSFLLDAVSLAPKENTTISLRPWFGDWYGAHESGMLAPNLIPSRFNALTNASFEDTKTSTLWPGWKPRWMSNSKLLQSVDGRLKISLHTEGPELVTSMLASKNSETPLIPFKLDHSSTEMMIVLQGAALRTDSNQRLCMLGCAARPTQIPPYDFEYTSFCNKSSHCRDEIVPNNQDKGLFEKDCSILVQMRYPNHNTLTTRFVKTLITSLRSVDDRLYFSPVSILAPLDIATYKFVPEETLNSMTMDNKVVSPEVSGSSLAIRKDYLIRYLECQRWSVLQEQLQNASNLQQRFMTGPFTTQVDLTAPIAPGSAVFITAILSIKNIFCQPTGSGKDFLVSGIAKVQTFVDNWGQSVRTKSNLVSIEGRWNHESGELCLVGCQENSPLWNKVESDIPNSGCDIKICLHSLLKAITLESPQGATIKSLLKANHHDYFHPLNLQPLWTFPPFEVFENNSFRRGDLYNFTRISEAIDLAKKNETTNSEALYSEGGLTFPTIVEGDECQKATRLIQNLRISSFDAHGVDQGLHRLVHMRLSILFVDSCDYEMREWIFVGSHANETTRTYPPGTYLNVAVRLSLQHPEFSAGRYREVGSPAEGVYEPHTGKMHLVACLQSDSEANYSEPRSLRLNRLGGAVTDVKDCRVYVKVQYPPLNPSTPYQQRLRMTVKSLRPQSDPLYFAPAEIEGPCHLYAQEAYKVIRGWQSLALGRLFIQTVLIFCIMRQMTHSRRNTDLLPFVSLTMLGLQAFVHAARILIFHLLFGQQILSFDEHEIVVKVLGVVACLLLIVLINRAYDERILLRVKQRRTKPDSRKVQAPHESKTTQLSAIVYGILLLISIAHAFLDPPVDSTCNRFVPPYERYWNSWLSRGLTTFWSFLQDFYLVPQVIGNVLWDTKAGSQALGLTFIVGASILRTIPYFYNTISLLSLYSSTTPSWIVRVGQLNGNTLRLVAWDMGVVFLVGSLAVLVLLQQRHGGRFGCFALPPLQSCNTEQLVQEYAAVTTSDDPEMLKGDRSALEVELDPQLETTSSEMV